VQPYAIAVLVATIGIFGTSAWAKLRGREPFRTYRAGLRATHLIPEPALALVAATLAAVEIAAAVLALTAVVATCVRSPAAPTIAVVAMLVAAGVMAVLTAGVIASIRRGSDAPCVCFGTSTPLGPVHAIRNGLLLMALIVGAAGTAGAGPAHLLTDVIAALAGGIAATLFIHADDLVDLFASAPSGREERH